MRCIRKRIKIFCPPSKVRADAYVYVSLGSIAYLPVCRKLTYFLALCILNMWSSFHSEETRGFETDGLAATVIENEVTVPSNRLFLHNNFIHRLPFPSRYHIYALFSLRWYNIWVKVICAVSLDGAGFIAFLVSCISPSLEHVLT